MSIITEIVKMKTVESVNGEEFIKIVDALEKEFHSKQKGFIDTELIYNEEEHEWYMIQHWESRDNLKEASKNMFIDKNAEAFVKSLDKKSVKMFILIQIKIWKK